MNKLVSGAIGIEIPLTDNVFRYFLPDVLYLRNKRIKHIDFCFYPDLEKTPSGSDVSQLTSGILLTLREANTQEEKISQLPVNELNASGNRLFINKIIDIQKSYIDLTGNPANLSDTSFYLVFWYDEPGNWEQIPSNCRTIIESFNIQLSGTKTYFSEFRNLINKKYQNILVALPTVLPSGITSIDDSELKTKFITLVRNSNEYFSNIPLYLFYQTNQNFKLRLQNISFDFQKSYILNVGDDNGKGIFFNCIIDDNNNFKTLKKC
ncbi:MAG: hypothetical protein BGO29_04580 [Bacteroidales bacterium 36-12]|nr:MAG: hypothetical protein BGO29_04580 [Bacteroidales bacterium 36-12]